MKLLLGAVLFLAFVKVQQLRRGRPMPLPQELNAAFNDQGHVPHGMRYKHTCAACVPLLQHGRYDLYVCQRGGGWPTAVARYGDRPSEHISSNDLSLPDEGIKIVFTRE